MYGFIQKAIQKEDIILKSKGNQFYSYCYVADAVSGIVKVLLDGKCTYAYNIAGKECDMQYFIRYYFKISMVLFSPSFILYKDI